MNDIVYFACNDWNPNPEEADNICYNYLGSYKGCEEEEIVNKTNDESEKWVKDNRMCINWEIIDMSISYYITAPRKVFEIYFKELLPFIKNEPYDFLWIGDKKCFLEYKEENYGFHYFQENDVL